MRPEVSEALDAEVLVVGGGAAACMAAIAAQRAGARVVVIDKGQLGKSGCSPNAHGGLALYHKDPRDNWRVHMEDTLMSGGFLNDQELVKILTTEGRKFLEMLESFGSLFDRERDGSIAVRPFGGHRYNRTVFSGDESGHEMMNGLKREMMKRDIPILDEVMAVSVLTNQGRATGVLGWNIGTGQFYTVQAPATILCTAEAAGIWPAASERQRGDGFSLALYAGAELADLEFIQYHPTHAWWPFGVRGSVSESFRGEGGWLLNSEGERFMERYDPQKMELCTRDKVSVCIHKEIRAGRGAPHGGIFASVAHLPKAQVERRLRVIYRKYLSYGYDITKEPIEVKPRPHYHCGGVVINTRAETTVPGLYAAGAITAGVHGANRLGANALVDILVFGEIAGTSAAEMVRQLGPEMPIDRSQVEREIGKIDRLFHNASLADHVVSAPLRRRHTELMDLHMGVMRTDEGIRTMLAEIERARHHDLPRLAVRDSSRVYNYELRDALEQFFRLDVEEMATRAALARTESRGGHYREDFPTRNDRDWLVTQVWTRDPDGDLRSEKRPVPQPIIKLEDLPEYANQDSPWH